MPNKKVILRADGNSEIGMGHFYRTLALGEMLKNDFECIFATQTPVRQQINELKKTFGNLINLPANDTHFNQFLNHLNGNEIVVLDNYYFDTSYQKKIKDKGCKLVCIDDIHDKHYVADIVINHAPGLNKSVFSTENYTKLLLGLDYTLLRKDFLSENKEKKVIENFKNMLILFGGADKFNLTLKYLELVSRIKSFSKINIITGSAYLFNQELHSFIKASHKDIIHNHSITPKKIIKIMDAVDVAISPASTVLYELISRRVPVISGYYVNNQMSIYKGFLSKGLIIDGGDLNQPQKFTQIIENLSKYSLNKIIDKEKSAIDFNSDKRIIEAFKTL